MDEILLCIPAFAIFIGGLSWLLWNWSDSTPMSKAERAQQTICAMCPLIGRCTDAMGHPLVECPE
jgi:hypothetical protein